MVSKRNIKNKMINKQTEKILQWGIIITTGVLVIVGSSVTLFAFKAMQNSKRITDIQVEQIKKINEQIGKPQVIEQRYITVKEKE